MLLRRWILPDHQNLRQCYTWQEGTGAANQLSLEHGGLGATLGWPDRPNIIKMVFIIESRRQEKQFRRCHRRKDCWSLPALTMERHGEPRHATASRKGKGKEPDPPLEPSDGTQPCWHWYPGFSLIRSILEPVLQNHKKIQLCLLSGIRDIVH